MLYRIYMTCFTPVFDSKLGLYHYRIRRAGGYTVTGSDAKLGREALEWGNTPLYGRNSSNRTKNAEIESNCEQNCEPGEIIHSERIVTMESSLGLLIQ